MMNSFPGFPEDLFGFLQDLSRNNNREWFTANKDRYQASVVSPVSDFILAMGQRLHKISSSFVADPRPHGGSMFRIYRDTRFSKDKRPYKENVGCQFRHVAGKSAHAPGFYVHLQPGNVFVGGGIWAPPNPVLDKIRTAIVERPGGWEEVLGRVQAGKGPCSMEGEQLKRPPRGYDADHRFIEDIKRTSFFVMRDEDPSLVIKPEFIDVTEDAFKTAAPLVEFITHALGLTF
jgi:uncharacterized protein (TIGR02453 family)